MLLAKLDFGGDPLLLKNCYTNPNNKVVKYGKKTLEFMARKVAMPLVCLCVSE